MDWAQFIALMTTLLGAFVFVYREMKAIQSDIKEETNTIRQETVILRQEMQIQSKRSDDL